MLYLLYFPALTIVLLLYFRLAQVYSIIDRPNHRSSHAEATIRGAGIVFPLALLSIEFINGFGSPLYTVGLLLISLVSFYDDLRPLSNLIRLFIHISSVLLLFIQVDLVSYSIGIILLSFVLTIGTINAYNFMDGINGITGAYSLLTILSLLFVNQFENFVSAELMIVGIISLLVFLFFNFRAKAKCFAGDVGSVSIAFFVIFLLLLLILKTENLKYILLLLIYGLDTVTTIVFRMLRRENIFEAHKSHFYQYLANGRKWSHIRITLLYVFLQLLINVAVIFTDFNLLSYILILLIAGFTFIIARWHMEGRALISTSWQTTD